ncbi:NAD-dependent epimerase/dehydratase family protein [Streptomyces morookaense]|uniref:NAD-dependent epimerase/dehydratase family protein n=1 Tax=Streptomyces morookaense TaxID=1970 RepID=A0A7Y7B5A1_STRMO|nr:NAD-dependent epimerase/dehydratase family protein [Streptomyces morookaense]NVK79134.1 NAD-dependent epimerase/dehydratase family protein [Streptomyces morookaense]GHF28293.1 NAD-dependent epimerase [Streptomyces morookaense]
MEIIGRGFVAQNFRTIAHRHPDVVVYATGVASTTATSSADFGRDAEQLYETIRACRSSGRRLVFLSTASSAMYGAVEGAAVEDGPVFPSMPYGRHKLAMEVAVARSGVDFLICRMTNLVGPSQRPHQLLPSLVAQVRSGRVRVHSGAHRDLLDVAHARAAMDGLLEAGVSGETVNLASGFSVPVEDVVAYIEQQLGMKARRETVAPAGQGSAAPVSIAKLARLLPGIEQRFGLGPRYFENVISRYLDSPVPA